jgi:hypothetical protein
MTGRWPRTERCHGEKRNIKRRPRDIRVLTVWPRLRAGGCRCFRMCGWQHFSRRSCALGSPRKGSEKGASCRAATVRGPLQRPRHTHDEEPALCGSMWPSGRKGDLAQIPSIGSPVNYLRRPAWGRRAGTGAETRPVSLPVLNPLC